MSTEKREIEIQQEIWKLMQELGELHQARTQHPVWVHRRVWDSAFRCFGGCDDTRKRREEKT
jgi:hypothetical protein